jgi:hypothetical protein
MKTNYGDRPTPGLIDLHTAGNARYFMIIHKEFAISIANCDWLSSTRTEIHVLNLHDIFVVQAPRKSYYLWVIGLFFSKLN